MANSYQRRTAAANYRFWKMSSDYDISDAYESYSTAKASAWRYCRYLCERMGGYGLKVVNRNSFVFTAGFESVNPETGVIEFTYITPNYDITIDAPCA